MPLRSLGLNRESFCRRIDFGLPVSAVRHVHGFSSTGDGPRWNSVRGRFVHTSPIALVDSVDHNYNVPIPRTSETFDILNHAAPVPVGSLRIAASDVYEGPFVTAVEVSLPPTTSTLSNGLLTLGREALGEA